MSEMNPLTRTTENGSSKELDLQALKDAAYRTGNTQLAAQIAFLCDEHQELRSEIDELKTEIKRLQDAVDAHFEEDAALRRRVTALETRASRPTGTKLAARADTLRALLIASGGKMLLDDARKRLDLSSAQFSQLINTMRGEVATRPLHANKRRKVIYLVNSLCKQ